MLKVYKDYLYILLISFISLLTNTAQIFLKSHTQLHSSFINKIHCDPNFKYQKSQVTSLKKTEMKLLSGKKFTDNYLNFPVDNPTL